MSPRARGGKGSDHLRTNAEVNLTSLIDLAFVLLVIFIITAPVMQGGLEVKLPQAEVQQISSQDDPFIVTVFEDGAIAIEETPVTFEEFDDMFPQLFEIRTPSTVYIRADAGANYGEVYRIMGTVYSVAGEAGSSVGMIGEDLSADR